MLIKRGVKFRNKNFAIGSRIEHPQALINQSQWGHECLPGVKAAEYRLTSNNDKCLPVYTFCMCPGGVIVPSTAYKEMSTVNGMSFHLRDKYFTNAGCVAAVNLGSLLGNEPSSEMVLDWVEDLERKFYDMSENYRIPACGIDDFISNSSQSSASLKSSYPLGLVEAPLWELLPQPISQSIRAGLVDFSRKIKGFETGLIMGLESKTSSPIQAIREEDKRCVGFLNLYMAGEGSGYSGGIVSSAADGIKVALILCE